MHLGAVVIEELGRFALFGPGLAVWVFSSGVVCCPFPNAGVV